MYLITAGILEELTPNAPYPFCQAKLFPCSLIRSRAMSAIPANLPALPPPIPIPDWRGGERLGLNWRRVQRLSILATTRFWQFRRSFSAFCLRPSARPHPLPPMYTHFHPRSPNPPKNRQRVASDSLFWLNADG